MLGVHPIHLLAGDLLHRCLQVCPPLLPHTPFPWPLYSDGVETCIPWMENTTQQIDLAFNIFFMVYFFIRVSFIILFTKDLFNVYSFSSSLPQTSSGSCWSFTLLWTTSLFLHHLCPFTWTGHG